MQLGMIGLGRMGGNIVRRLMRHGHMTVVYDKDPKAVAAIAALFARFRSRKEHTFAEKILSAMRAGFGGHREPAKKPGSKA
ncbi:NAD(P)-binding domain-containing protein [Bradyrhizobium sp.]|uniref:NAD(P)-binding domain-containing protein n=1 Tax=Bradyrhizobium sp. TaxID=376 RepID=UPI003C790D0B